MLSKDAATSALRPGPWIPPPPSGPRAPSRLRARNGFPRAALRPTPTPSPPQPPARLTCRPRLHGNAPAAEGKKRVGLFRAPSRADREGGAPHWFFAFYFYFFKKRAGAVMANLRHPTWRMESSPSSSRGADVGVADVRLGWPSPPAGRAARLGWATARAPTPYPGLAIRFRGFAGSAFWASPGRGLTGGREWGLQKRESTLLCPEPASACQPHPWTARGWTKKESLSFLVPVLSDLTFLGFHLFTNLSVGAVTAGLAHSLFPRLHCLQMLSARNQFSSLQSLSRVRLCTAARQASCPSPTPGVYANSCPSSRWCHPNHLILCCPLLLLPSVVPSILSSESVLRIR